LPETGMAWTVRLDECKLARELRRQHTKNAGKRTHNSWHGSPVGKVWIGYISSAVNVPISKVVF